jgi:hypothetical protein
MLPLIGKIFSLFAFKSKNVLFIVIGILIALEIIYPILIDPIIKNISFNQRVNTITRLTNIDKTKFKEPILKNSYDSLIKEFSSKNSTISIEKGLKVIKFKELLIYENLIIVIVGAILWIILAIISLFAFNAKLIHRILVFIVFVLIGFILGSLLLFVGTIKPLTLYIMIVISLEVILINVFGTLIVEINRN